MARQFQQRRFERSARPNRTWTGFVPAVPSTVPAASKLLIATFVLDNPGIDETVLRVVGGVAVSSDQAAATENQIGAIGMCIVTDTAVAAGVGSLPDPVTDIADDIWFWYQSFGQRFLFSDATGVQSNAMTWYSFDNKAKRILSSGQSIVVIAANASASEGLLVTPTFRMLTQVRGTR